MTNVRLGAGLRARLTTLEMIVGQVAEDPQLTAAIQAQAEAQAAAQAQVESQVAALQEVAATATDVIATSSADRASLRENVDTLMAQVAALQANGQVSADALAALQATLATVESEVEAMPTVTAVGVSLTPAVALLANADVTIALSATMPTTGYTVQIGLPPAMVGTAQVTVKNRTRTTVTLNVKALAAVAAGTIVVLASS